MGINTVDGGVVGCGGGRVGFAGWSGGRECWVVGVVGWWLDGWLGSAIMPTYIYIRNHREPSMHIYDDYE